MAYLLDLTLRGSAVALAVILLDACFARRMRASWRRWWWLCVPVAFLFTLRLPVLPVSKEIPFLAKEVSGLTQGIAANYGNPLGPWNEALITPWITLWLVGALASLTWLLVQTALTTRQWRGERLCTETRLLDLLEDCKKRAGVTAPIGLVLTDRLDAPAILGWLRPRILLPRQLAATATDARLAHVFWHELAHFRAWDIPCGWAFSLARCVHWFNPLAYFAERGWARFREEAADECAVAWANDTQVSAYGETLLSVIRQTGRAQPFGALAIGETFPNLKRRILMIKHYHQKSPRTVLAFLAFAVLASLALLQPVRAEGDAKMEATAAMEVWLKGIDDGDYAASWQNASPDFQKAISSAQWVKALEAVRNPLGKLESRKLVSAMHQTEIPNGTQILKGDFVIAQFESAFANMKSTIETVTFEKDGDTWKSSGYFIKPN